VKTEVYHSKTTFPNLHKPVIQLNERDVNTNCPDVTDTYGKQAKLNNKFYPSHTMKA
jgi:hypothetical protein